MAMQKLKVTQADISRAVKAAISAGLQVGSVEVDQVNGKIVLKAAAPEEARPAPEAAFDKWMAAHAR